MNLDELPILDGSGTFLINSVKICYTNDTHPSIVIFVVKMTSQRRRTLTYPATHYYILSTRRWGAYILSTTGDGGQITLSEVF